MPNRLIREGFLDSPAIAGLGDTAECFYHRLLLAADDAGRFDARVEILRSRLYPADSSRRITDLEKSLALCVKQGLIIPYEWDSKPFLQLTKVYRSGPSTNSKFPWIDGNYKFRYVTLQTRDGDKEFVETSIPSATLGKGLGMGSEGLGGHPPVYGDGDGDDKPPISPADAGDSSAAKNSISEILEVYHAKLPNCQRIAVLNDKRKKRLVAAEKLAKKICASQNWRYVPAVFWGAFFGECASDPWMRGDVPNPNNPAWKQNLDVLLTEDRIASVMDKAIAAMRGAQ